MNSPDFWIILGNIVALLSASLLAGGLFSRFGHSPLVGYLLAGMLLGGPGSLKIVGSASEIETIAELGVALLLFSLGLEFSLDRLKKLGIKPLLGGATQIFLTILFVFIGASFFGVEFKQSIALGAMVALSSTAIVLRILMERGEMEMPHGRNSLAVLLTQDMAVVPLALLMAILGGEGSVSAITLNIAKLLSMICALIVGLVILNKIAIRVLGTLTLHRNRELTVLFAVVAGLGATWSSHYAGISPALGAFIAGMLLGNSAFATQIRADISPLRVVLLTLFFSAAGMVADPIWIINNCHIVLSVTILLILGKLIITWLIFLALGETTRVASATGLCLSQVGEFAFVLGSIGRASGVVTQEMYALVVSVTIVSFFLSAFLVPFAPSFGNIMARLLKADPLPAENANSAKQAPDILIIGFGPAGQIAASSVIDKNLKVTVIDLNKNGIRKAQQQGFSGQVGDATQREILEHVNLAACKIVIITIPHYQSAILILKHVRNEAPNAHIIVRSRYQMHTNEFTTAGAHAVIGDEEKVGENIAAHLLEWLSSEEELLLDSSKGANETALVSMTTSDIPL